MSRLAEMKDRLKALFVEYGAIAVVIHLTLFALVFLGFYIGFSMGLGGEEESPGTGTLVAAYVAAQLTKPVRILVVLSLTPIVAMVLPASLRNRLRPKQHSSKESTL